MKNLVDYLDKAKAKSGSDYKTSKELGISKQAISKARSGGGMTPENCTKIAMYLTIDPMKVIAASEISKHPDKAKFWGKWIAAAVILSAMNLSIFSNKAMAYEGFKINDTIDYAQLGF